MSVFYLRKSASSAGNKLQHLVFICKILEGLSVRIAYRDIDSANLNFAFVNHINSIYRYNIGVMNANKFIRR